LELDYQVQAADYLDFVHDVPVHDFVKPDPVLRSILESLPQRKVVFTNANTAHTSRVLSALGVEDYFEKVIDVLQLSPYCKPFPEAFQIAMSSLGDMNPSHYALLDDSIRNIQTSLNLGMKAVLVNPGEVDHDSVIRIDSIHDLPKIWTKLNGDGYV
jgi:putative hydrolase of the HAD superfamily